MCRSQWASLRKGGFPLGKIKTPVNSGYYWWGPHGVWNDPLSPHGREGGAGKREGAGGSKERSLNEVKHPISFCKQMRKSFLESSKILFERDLKSLLRFSRVFPLSTTEIHGKSLRSSGSSFEVKRDLGGKGSPTPFPTHL
ncbi:hypothetical protein CDAR_185021 [Caerostris darwini]|uniref:Uncharacterized protein n=1 Tax=Caerostris darwini TaxID=1538125 RepID=A0AAV4SRP1_9ARAC|nr:hypothetical protein CDAR_185021 [Caerostris darwini]